MIYILLLIFSFLFTYFIKNIMIKKSLVATVNNRSSHTIPTPHGGGIAIAFTYFIGLVYLYFNNLIDPNLFFALLVGFLISIVSFFDDLYELSPRLRLFVQSFVAILGLYFVGGFESLNLFFFSVDNQIVTNLFAFFLIVWFINLTNFIDGINGYVGCEFIFLSLAGLILFNDLHFLVLLVSVLGFLYWNYNQAKIFMGDVGSTLLGYNIAIFTIYYANIESTNFWIWIILFSLFWFDATITLIRRKSNGERLSQAHKKHAYQRLTQSGWSHFKVTNYSILVNIILFLLILLVNNLFISLLLTIILLSFLMKFIDKRKKFN